MGVDVEVGAEEEDRGEEEGERGARCLLAEGLGGYEGREEGGGDGGFCGSDGGVSLFEGVC